MRLKSLELQGFKTFPDRTTLSFDNGVTAVVGPNGSGKSNISDAIRWVLGEQSARTLRCARMEGLIFNGTPHRKAQGFAEVTLTIDNRDRGLAFDSDEVSITRRYYRSGESEYQLNKASVRLRDITELFLDTGLGRDGYSMIGQGKIDSIVAARSEDRREIFEEAAGISRFRYRKEEAENRLDRAEENLLRLRDILSELEERIGPLKEQSEKAQQFLALSGEKRTIEIGLWLETLERSGRILREHDDKLLVARSQYEDAEKAIEAIDAEIDHVFRQSNECAAKADELRQESARLEEAAARKDGEISVFENDILHANENIARIDRELLEAAQSGQSVDGEIAAKRAEIGEKNTEIETVKEKEQECSAALDELRRGMDEVSGRIADLSRAVAELTTSATESRLAANTAASSAEELRLRRAAAETSRQEKQERRASLEAERADCARLLEETRERIDSLRNAVRGRELRLESRRKKAEEAKKQGDALHLDTQERERRARLLEDLERNMEGFSQSVKTVMRETKRGALAGIHGPVSRLLQVPPQYAVAIETALGPAMQNIVVSTERDAKLAIGLLKQRDAGRATFLPVSTIRGSLLREQGLEDCAGFVGLAGRLCQCKPEYEGILHSLLGRIVIAEDLDSAVAIAKRFSYRFRVVTLDGQVVNAGGSLTGGSLARNSGLLSRRAEIDRLRAEAKALAEQTEQAQARWKTLQEEAAREEAELSAVRAELSTAQEDAVRFETEEKSASAALESLSRDEDALRREDEESARRLEELENSRMEAERKAAGCTEQMAGLQEQLSKIHESRDESNRRSDELAAQLQEHRMRMLELRKDISALETMVEELERRRAGHEDRAEALRREKETVEGSLAGIRARIEEVRREAERLRGEAKKAADGIESVNSRRMELERQTTELRAREREKSSERERVGHEVARLEERRGNLQKEYDEITARLWEEYELTRREAEESYRKPDDPQQARRRLNEIKTAIKSLGSVNVAAIEEYKEVSERYEFLSAQVSDVEQSRDSLRRLIAELTKQMKDLFLERFSEISRHFTEVFRELFGGGTAELSLSDPEDVLQCGIDIAVQPPGKIVNNLESLSGGEKALVAIALYFAIMKVNPPPFCVLDEIEAALDDVNVTRFAAYLRRMNQRTQFIAITHRRGTMEEADVLYGVTMQDEGVSKLLKMSAAEIEQHLLSQKNA